MRTHSAQTANDLVFIVQYLPWDHVWCEGVFASAEECLERSAEQLRELLGDEPHSFLHGDGWPCGTDDWGEGYETHWFPFKGDGLYIYRSGSGGSGGSGALLLGPFQSIEEASKKARVGLTVSMGTFGESIFKATNRNVYAGMWVTR